MAVLPDDEFTSSSTPKNGNYFFLHLWYMAAAVYDFRMSADKCTPLDLVKKLKLLAKKWTFQKEKGEKKGYLHYQGRLSLRKKTTKSAALSLFGDLAPNYLEPTVSSEHRKESFYVVKDQTRVDGPWSDTDPEPAYIPVQYRNVELTNFQEYILANLNTSWRIIDLLVDTTGGRGKTTVAAIGSLVKGHFYVPCIDDYKVMMEFICSGVHPDPQKAPKVFFIDIPRAVKQNKLAGIYAALETLKGGYLFDTRNKAKFRWIDSPTIWVFTNTKPDLNMLTKDRWRFWRINSNDELVRI